MSDQPLKLPSHEEGAVLSSTFEEAILPQYWLTAQREQSLNTGADSWSFRCKSFFFFSSFSSASTQDGTLRNQKLYTKSFSKKPAWRVSLLDLSLISLLPSSSNASPLHSAWLPLLIYFLRSGVPDFDGVTQEHGCWKRRLFPEVCGAADVPGGDDGVLNIWKRWLFY